MSLNKTTTIRIRKNAPSNFKQERRKRNLSFNQYTSPTLPTESHNYLAEVKKIMSQAKQTSHTLNLQFRKISEKPDVEVVYITIQQLQKKLNQISARIDLGKYYVLVEVKKDALNGLAEKKKQSVTDQIARKNYKTIYKEYLKNLSTQSSVKILDNPLVTLYQFYDDEERDWKESLKSRNLIAREAKKQKIQKQKQGQKQKQKQVENQLHQSRRSAQSYQKYEKMFEDVAYENGFFQPIQSSLPRAEKIVIDRFQNKFYRCREKKFEHAIDRLVNPQTLQSSSKIEQQEIIISPKKKKSIKLTIPESCKRVYNTQNKLLQQNTNKGLSDNHKKKLIVQFNKTILDMKISDQPKNPSKIFRNKSIQQRA